MPSRSETVTSSRFERRLPGGKHDLLFKVAFGSYGAAARFFDVGRMSIWRWTHDKAPLPRYVADVLSDLIQSRVAEAHAAQDGLRYICALPPPPPRKLTGVCAGRHRRAKRLPVTAEDWATLGD